MRFLSILWDDICSLVKGPVSAETRAREEDEEGLDLRSRVQDAVHAGTGAREEDEERLARESREALRRIIEWAPARARAILNNVPLAVKFHFQNRGETATSICVMRLDSIEYGGEINRRGELHTEQLQYAGKLVFDALTDAALKPELRIGHTPGDDSSKYDYGRLVVEIHINVDPNG